MTERVEIKTINQVILDTFVRFEFTDDQGKGHYTGKVIKIHKDSKMFDMQCMEGLMSFTVSDKTKLLISDKPTGWDKFEKNPAVYFEKQREKADEENQIKTTLKETVFKFAKDNAALDNDKLLKKCLKEVPGDEKLIKMFIKVSIMQKNRGNKNVPA